MAKKEFTYRGMKVEELKKLSIKEFAALIPSNARRHLTRGLTEPEQKLMASTLR